ncbi:UNVERIFIED_CONTAM: hypothetical protein FKN15_038872 [Acipenser sinensis]
MIVTRHITCSNDTAVLQLFHPCLTDHGYHSNALIEGLWGVISCHGDQTACVLCASVLQSFGFLLLRFHNCDCLALALFKFTTKLWLLNLSLLLAYNQPPLPRSHRASTIYRSIRRSYSGPPSGTFNVLKTYPTHYKLNQWRLMIVTRHITCSNDTAVLQLFHPCLTDHGYHSNALIEGLWGVISCHGDQTACVLCASVLQSFGFLLLRFHNCPRPFFKRFLFYSLVSVFNLLRPESDLSYSFNQNRILAFIIHTRDSLHLSPFSPYQQFT